MKRYKDLVFLLLILLIAMLVINFFEPSLGTILTSILTTLTTLVGVFSVFYEMKRSADLEECNFILSLFKHFTSNETPEITIAYRKLDELFSTGKNTITKDDRENIVEYLQFFEMIVNLIKKDIITIEDIDSLFGYWFFIAVNCNIVQEMELNNNKEYYEGIYEIYLDWLKYRKMQGRAIPFEDTPLITEI